MRGLIKVRRDNSDENARIMVYEWMQWSCFVCEVGGINEDFSLI